MLAPFGPDLYYADGPMVSFFGFPYPTRMAVARLSSGDVWVWSPIALTRECAREIEAIGPVCHVVSPNKLHHLSLVEWKERWPTAQFYAPPGLPRRMRGFHFDATLDENPQDAWSADIDQTVFRGSIVMSEVVFFHRVSRTAIFGDLIQRFSAVSAAGWRGALLRLDGLVGAHGSTPLEWRLSFLARTAARTARRKVLEWQPERLLIAHGECVAVGAAPVIAASLSWI